MKPKIGDKVYCIYNCICILGTKVAFLGEHSFINDNFFNGGTSSDSWEYDYDGYGVSWFTKLSEAKEMLLRMNQSDSKQKFTIEKYGNNYWEIRC